MRRGSVGLDGAEAQYCDLSGRGLSTLQIERTLCVFEAADAIDLSNNEIESVPSTIPPTILALDLSFNLIANAQGVDRLKNLQEIHLGFNRLMDVSVLEFCPLLQHVNLSGNRLMNTRGLETLAFLENLNLSENLIEFPEALRPLSLNLHLTHLTLRGNPIAINTKNDYRVLLLDMIPSVLMLDDKKIRNAVKCKTVKGASAAKSLSYSRLYDDKKQFVIRNKTRPRPATKVKPLIAGESSTKYDGTMFLQPATEPSHERVRSLQVQHQQLPIFPSDTPLSSSHMYQSHTAQLPPAPHLLRTLDTKASMKTSANPALYMSMYDRLAHANSVQLTKSAIPPSKPIESRPNPHNTAFSTTTARTHNVNAATTTKTTNSTVPRANAAIPTLLNGSRRGSTSRSPGRTRSVTGRQIGNNNSNPTKRSSTSAGDPRNATATTSHRPSLPSKTSARTALDDKQKNVLSVIQNLIQHKKQTLATLASASPPVTT